jgi:hypothetical protein
MTPEIELGAWITAAHKALSRWNPDTTALDPFDSIITAGKTGDLFSATRAMGKIEGAKFEAHRMLVKLRPTLAKQVLKSAEALGLVDIDWSNDDSAPISGFRFNRHSREGVLEAVGLLFPTLGPTKIALAALEILGSTLVLPRSEGEIRNLLSKGGFRDGDIDTTIRLVTELGLISKTDETQDGSPLLFNPLVFEKNAKEIHQLLLSLDSEDQEEAVKIIDYVQKNPGIPLPAGTNPKILSLLVKVGVIDYSKIVTLTSASGAHFPTAPHIWGIFDKSAGSPLSQDLIDDCKLLLNSFRYGQFYSHPSRGKIMDPSLIVNALIRDGAIGVQKPATAIGQDYPLALSRGIVNIVESRLYPGRYSMELLKFDVAGAVKDVLQQHAILPKETLPTEEELKRAGQFISPTAVRVEVELPASLKRYHEEIVFGLRTMRRKN